MDTYSKPITHLQEDEVFVFGANLDGFHGAGSAGYASFGEFGNKWREFNYGSKPKGWKGKWNEKGKVGPQVGTEGKSYGLPTVTKVGCKRSLNIDFKPLFECCRRNPQWKFYFAQTAETGLNGWSVNEIVRFINEALPIPDNFYIHESLINFFSETY